jgi:hypothetical protein
LLAYAFSFGPDNLLLELTDLQSDGEVQLYEAFSFGGS